MTHYTQAHWGTYRVEQGSDGAPVLRHWEKDPDPCDIGLHMHVSRIVPRQSERLEMARVGEQIDVHHTIRALRDQQPHERRADEARAAGHEQGLDLVALDEIGHDGVA